MLRRLRCMISLNPIQATQAVELIMENIAILLMLLLLMATEVKPNQTTGAIRSRMMSTWLHLSNSHTFWALPSIGPNSDNRIMCRGSIVLIFIGTLLFCSNSSVAQLSQKSEIGFGLGVFNYTGDLVRTYDLTTSKPAATVFYRSNISRVISLRTSITGGQLAASDRHKPIDSAAIKRNASF